MAHDRPVDLSGATHPNPIALASGGRSGSCAACCEDEAKMEGILVPITLFVVLGIGIVIPFSLRSRERMKVLEVVRSISEQGATPPPQLLAALEAIAQRDPLATPERDMRRGATLLAVCAAMIAMGVALYFLTGARQPFLAMAGASAFPGFIGLTQLGFWLAARSKRDL
jgi:hypothetical protein